VQILSPIHATFFEDRRLQGHSLLLSAREEWLPFNSLCFARRPQASECLRRSVAREDDEVRLIAIAEPFVFDPFRVVVRARLEQELPSDLFALFEELFFLGCSAIQTVFSCGR
jgi:hypothetical protein